MLLLQYWFFKKFRNNLAAQIRPRKKIDILELCYCLVLQVDVYFIFIGLDESPTGPIFTEFVVMLKLKFDICNVFLEDSMYFQNLLMDWLQSKLSKYLSFINVYLAWESSFYFFTFFLNDPVYILQSRNCIGQNIVLCIKSRSMLFFIDNIWSTWLRLTRQDLGSKSMSS